MKFLCFNIVVFVFVLSCTNKDNSSLNSSLEPRTITIPSKIEDVVKLSEVFDEPKFIQLQSNGRGAISIDKIILNDGKMFVLDATVSKGVYVYDLNGRFINRIGQIGEGPGEYLDIADFDIYRNEIAISERPSKIHLFKSNGTFKSTKNVKFIFRSFISTESGFLFFTEFRGEPKFNVIETDKDLEFKKGYFPFTKDEFRSMIPTYLTNFVRIGDSDVYFSYPFSNTIYLWNKVDFIPKMRFVFESNGIPKGKGDNISKPEDLRAMSKYSQLDFPFFSLESTGLYGLSIAGRSRYFIETPKRDFLANILEDDYNGVPFYIFHSIDSEQVVGVIAYEALSFFVGANANPGVKISPNLKTKLLDLVKRYEINPETSEPIVVLFPIKK